ncbi:hypothetical protein RF11_12522 [Thelohanellus kitauei]|uniref:Uncharacterized protein n=1 Tax=Thelohanellus kitauei TaxID=669202 RepID=A0A0C2MQB7_THEKT|nr:hypothetical protein RF11_12522 [Thelohanellus kitauei]
MSDNVIQSVIDVKNQLNLNEDNTTVGGWCTFLVYFSIIQRVLLYSCIYRRIALPSSYIEVRFVYTKRQKAESKNISNSLSPNETIIVDVNSLNIILRLFR